MKGYLSEDTEVGIIVGIFWNGNRNDVYVGILLDWCENILQFIRGGFN